MRPVWKVSVPAIGRRIVPQRAKLGGLAYREPGEAVVQRQLFRGRIWNAVPARVVEDGSEQTVLWFAPGTRILIGRELFGDWSLDRVIGLRAGELRIARPDEPFSVLLFHHRDGSFRGWYVNLERPQRRTALGFDFEDDLLDIWVERGKDPELLDEDELEEAVERKIFSAERAAQIRANAARILASPPWPTGWESWEPDPGWQVPTLPPGWDQIGD
jgi:hypothetical protein